MLRFPQTSHPKKPCQVGVDVGNRRFTPLKLASIVTGSIAADDEVAIKAATIAASLFYDARSRNLRSVPGKTLSFSHFSGDYSSIQYLPAALTHCEAVLSPWPLSKA